MKHHSPRGAVTASHAPPCVCCDVPVSARILPWQWGGLNAPLIHPVSPLLPPPGSPLQFYVDYVNSGHVTAYGPGLIHGTVNKPATFTVNTKDAGEGEPLGGSARCLGPPRRAQGPPLNPTCPPPHPRRSVAGCGGSLQGGDQLHRQPGRDVQRLLPAGAARGLQHRGEVQRQAHPREPLHRPHHRYGLGGTPRCCGWSWGFPAADPKSPGGSGPS